ncbi:hypothetical protein F477_03665 [Pseudomonas sp. URIL14HWK12:I3]|uniref:hypothetical protein n=1 Tax=unclassified Pseudomonas TaxID=196821 RepID=UPI000DAD99DB|nr:MULTISPECIES: hypothetical protein [unclassified Pseudomonas]PZW52819.1 hypothetical protein F478_02614 [Pseudomonas sp. URIL14HWK12:I2]PZW53564.1 hypothetical protein F477_03665 [Pseudomonas sp. URIL14HWK12:I3]
MDISAFTAHYAPAFSALSALASAYAWLRSATAKVPFSVSGKNGEAVQAPSIGFDEKGERYNLQETLVKQAHWNRVAACFSAIAAMFFAVQVFGVPGVAA